MTVGLAAYGDHSGCRVLAGIRRAEELGSGDIGGFVVLAALLHDGLPLYLTCQRGGIEALLRHPGYAEDLARFHSATIAAAITSGPDRPEPLVQFLPASAAGLVTGHRMPNSSSTDGSPMNQSVLSLLAAGVSPSIATRQVASNNPEANAGLLAVTQGDIGFANTQRTLRREDLGEYLEQDGRSGFALLHNSINPTEGLSSAIGDAMRAAT